MLVRQSSKDGCRRQCGGARYDVSFVHGQRIILLLYLEEEADGVYQVQGLDALRVASGNVHVPLLLP